MIGAREDSRPQSEAPRRVLLCLYPGHLDEFYMPLADADKAVCPYDANHPVAVYSRPKVFPTPNNVRDDVSRIGVVNPERFGGDPRARWLRQDDELREDWNEVEFIRVDDVHRWAGDALGEIAALASQGVAAEDGQSADLAGLLGRITRIAEGGR